MPDISTKQLIRLNKLAQTVVFIFQGIPFIFAGEEVFRDKKGVRNSYKSPDIVNVIDWARKADFPELFEYYRALIELCKNLRYLKREILT